MLDDLKTRALKLGTAEDVIADLEAAGLLWWHVAHQEPDPNKRPPISADLVECGYFAVSSGAHAPIIPCAIWKDDNEIRANRGFRRGPLAPESVDVVDVRKSWVWIAKKPISYQRYEAALNAGKWPDEIDRHGIGGNIPPEPIDAEAAEKTAATREDLILQYAATVDATRHQEILDIGIKAEAAALAWLKLHAKGLPDQATADAGMHMREDLNKLYNLAEIEREAESGPLWRAYKAANARWDFAKKLKTAADRIFASCKAWGDQERRAREQAALDAVKANTPIAQIKPVEPVKFQTGAKTVSLRTKKVWLITDYALALEFVKDRTAVKEAVQREVQALGEAGVTVPGTKEDRQAA